jgi:hypothetical protein
MSVQPADDHHRPLVQKVKKLDLAAIDESYLLCIRNYELHKKKESKVAANDIVDRNLDLTKSIPEVKELD